MLRHVCRPRSCLHRGIPHDKVVEILSGFGDKDDDGGNEDTQPHLAIQGSWLYDVHIPAHKVYVEQVAELEGTRVQKAGTYSVGGTRCAGLQEMLQMRVNKVGVVRCFVPSRIESEVLPAVQCTTYGAGDRVAMSSPASSCGACAFSTLCVGFALSTGPTATRSFLLV
jgi:hypothetical protein